MENSSLITRRQALGFAAAGLASSAFSMPALASPAPILVELFTSQGCSSCPAADKLAGTLMNEPGVHVVSFNVDYWDYLGWRDTLAKPAYTKRQMDYAHARGDMDVYTPQMVINGEAHVVGSNHGTVANAIGTARLKRTAVNLQLSATERDIHIDIPKGAEGSGTVWLMSLAPSIEVKIERGENSGKSIIYHNVVRKLVKAGSWSSDAAKLSVAKTELIMPDCKSCFAVLQQGDVGPVIGFAKLDYSAA
jgi:hypothetical protein